jgi:hypothetical protein
MNMRILNTRVRFLDVLVLFRTISLSGNGAVFIPPQGVENCLSQFLMVLKREKALSFQSMEHRTAWCFYEGQNPNSIY